MPVLKDPFDGVEHIIWYCRPIEDARGPAYPTVNAYVIGRDRAGRHRKFMVRLAEYERAVLRNVVKLIEVDNIVAPGGTIYDPKGVALTEP